ncbi:MAG: type VI secretion system baseplate subunit TssK [Holosporales bacterium]|jgi:type VI secretion system protein ImpJ|nr:type VI secretion system baseplate subunit TssK [Holosporales bacterium]
MSRKFEQIFPIPLGINWHEGMLLSQHHFQQNDLRNFQILANHVRLLSSNHFGVRHLRTDKVALTDGLYRINEIEAVFPDGLIFSYFPEKFKGLKPLEIDVAAEIPDDNPEVTIFIAIAGSSDEISPVLGNPARFYSVDGYPVSDDNIKDNCVKIPRLFPNAFLYIGAELPELCIGFPLCKIIFTDGVFGVKNWTPPCFFIEKHFPLWQRCLTLSQNLREKAVFLAEKLKNAVSDTVASDTHSILSQVMTVLPGFEALVYSNEIRPYDLYHQLADILGRVSALIPTEIPPVMQPYDHCNIDDRIYGVIKLIERYISVIERGFSVIRFNHKDRFFYHYFGDGDLIRCTSGKIYVGVRGDKSMSVSELEKWVENAVVVSDFALEIVRTNRVKGAERAPLRREIVSKILPGVGVMMFEIDINSRFIKGGQNIHMFNPGDSSDSRPVEIILYLPREPDGGS